MANLGVSFGPFNFFQLLFFKHFKQHVLSCLFGVAATQFNILKHLCQQMGSYRDVFAQRVKRGCAVCFAGACCMSCMSCNGWACWQARLRSPCGGEDSARRRSFRRSRVGVADGIPTGLQTQQRDEKTTGSRITCMLHVPATRLYKVEEVVTEPALCSTRWPCLMLPLPAQVIPIWCELWSGWAMPPFGSLPLGHLGPEHSLSCQSQDGWRRVMGNVPNGRFCSEQFCVIVIITRC